MTERQMNTNIVMAFVNHAETQEVLKTLALTHLDLTLEVQTGGVDEAIEYLKTNRSPKVLIVDVSEAQLPISQMQKLGETCDPGVKVIAMGDRNEVGIFRDLLEIGVKDYIAKPANTTLIVRSLERVLTSTPANTDVRTGFASTGQVIAFVGARGGVGTSTFASNCAWILSNKFFKRVGLIDLDLQFGVMSQIFDLDTTSALREALEDPDRIDDIFIERSMVKQSNNLQVLCAEEGLHEKMDFSPEGVNKLIQLLKDQFQYSIFDLPRTFYNQQNFNVLEKAGVVTIIADLTIFSVRETVRILRLLKGIKHPEQRVLIVLNRVKLYKKGELTLSMFEDSIQRKIDQVIDFDSVNPLEALNNATPIASEESQLSTGIHQVVDLMMGKDISDKSQSNKKLINYLFTK